MLFLLCDIGSISGGTDFNKIPIETCSTESANPRHQPPILKNPGSAPVKQTESGHLFYIAKIKRLFEEKCFLFSNQS